jgi:threonine aldolase
MGSLLCGTASLMEEGRRLRKMLGGGVRQGGVMGAAGLMALDYLPRIPEEDHAKARRLASGLRSLGLGAQEPETNIVQVPVLNAAETVTTLGNLGVQVLAFQGNLRFVTHRDLTESDVDEALSRIQPVVDKLLTTWEGNRPMV